MGYHSINGDAVSGIPDDFAPPTTRIGLMGRTWAIFVTPPLQANGCPPTRNEYDAWWNEYVQQCLTA